MNAAGLQISSEVLSKVTGLYRLACVGHPAEAGQVLELAIADPHWAEMDETAALKLVNDGTAVAQFEHELYESVGKAYEHKYGFVIWVIILGAIISGIVSALVRWWLEHRDHRALLTAARQS